MSSKYWLKLWHEIIDDPKMGKLSDRLWRRTIEIFLLAGETGKGGYLPSVEDMAWRLRVREDELQTDLADIASTGIIQKRSGKWFVTNFKKRQEPMPKAEYMRRLRVEDRTQYQNSLSQPVTKGNNLVTDAVTKSHADTDTDTDKETDKEAEAEEEGHGDVTVTEPATTPAPSTFSLFRSEIKDLLTQKGWKVDDNRLDECLVFWQDLTKHEGWRFKNGEVLLELYPPGGLEERREREAAKQAKANGHKQAKKLPGDWSPEVAEAMRQKIRAAKAKRDAERAAIAAQAD